MSAKALVIYLMSGPGMPELAEAAVDGGADILELGFPFSDPLAASETDGWLYLVTLTGTTGARAEVSTALTGLAERARRLAPAVPLYAGFGISTPEHAVAAAEHTDGVVVGSRAVQVAEEGPAALRAYVASLREALG